MLASLLIGLGSMGTSPPKYVALELHELIAYADLCFAGTIVEVDAQTISIEVETVGFGNPEKRVQVERFRDWTCASRWTPYEIGQRCLYFVAASKGEEAPWHILSGGGEGEMPLTGDDVKVRAKLPARS